MHALVPVTHRTTEHAAVKSALMGDGDGREDGTRTSDCRVTSDASASVCAVTWLLSQQQPALFGRAACAWHIMTSLLVLQLF